jgi:hypothetical protein
MQNGRECGAGRRDTASGKSTGEVAKAHVTGRPNLGD